MTSIGPCGWSSAAAPWSKPWPAPASTPPPRSKHCHCFRPARCAAPSPKPPPSPPSGGSDRQAPSWGGDAMAGDTGTQRVHTYCALCIARCGAIAVVEDGRFARLEPDPAHPTGQALCAKGRAAPELVYHPERLTHPLRRTRPKGDPDPGWECISWDEALELTAAAMRRAAERHGPQSVAFTLSSPSTTAIGDSSGFIQRMGNAFGTPNAAITLDVCGWGRAFATRFTYGVGSVGTGGARGAMPA